MSNKRTEADELFTTLHHLRNARKSLLRTGWSQDRDKVLADLDRTYVGIQKKLLPAVGGAVFNAAAR